MPIFYNLPTTELREGMSTNDGQDILRVSRSPEGFVFAEVFTPRSDDPEQDAINRTETETRMYEQDERVDLATFSDTEVDGSSLDEAQITEVAPDIES